MSIHEDDMELPDFAVIIAACKREMANKYGEYGNSWKFKELSDKPFWDDRLQGEVTEVMQAKNKFDEMEELIDVINIAAMRFTRLNEK